MQRRDLLASVAGSALTGMAGCAGIGTSGDDAASTDEDTGCSGPRITEAWANRNPECEPGDDEQAGVVVHAPDCQQQVYVTATGAGFDGRKGAVVSAGSSTSVQFGPWPEPGGTVTYRLHGAGGERFDERTVPVEDLTDRPMDLELSGQVTTSGPYTSQDHVEVAVTVSHSGGAGTVVGRLLEGEEVLSSTRREIDPRDCFYTGRREMTFGVRFHSPGEHDLRATVEPADHREARAETTIGTVTVRETDQ